VINYQARFEPEDGLFVVTFPDVGHGATTGASEAEAMEMAEDFLFMVLDELVAQGAELPEARVHRGKQFRQVVLPALVVAKLELYRVVRASGIDVAELARRVGISVAQVERLLDLKHKSNIGLVEAALRAVGHRLTVHVEAA
jgi:antitoxin HicB